MWHGLAGRRLRCHRCYDGGGAANAAAVSRALSPPRSPGCAGWPDQGHRRAARTPQRARLRKQRGGGGCCRQATDASRPHAGTVERAGAREGTLCSSGDRQLCQHAHQFARPPTCTPACPSTHPPTCVCAADKGARGALVLPGHAVHKLLVRQHGAAGLARRHPRHAVKRHLRLAALWAHHLLRVHCLVPGAACCQRAG